MDSTEQHNRTNPQYNITINSPYNGSDWVKTTNGKILDNNSFLEYIQIKTLIGMTVQLEDFIILILSPTAKQFRRELHWLPIRQRITFKLATITYKARRLGQPAYLSNSLHEYLPTRNLRSASALLLQQPPATTVFSSRAFPVAAPSVCTEHSHSLSWNFPYL